MKIQTNAPRPNHVLLAMGVFAVLLSVLLLWLGFRSMSIEKQFTDAGITTQGEITSKRVSQKTERDKDTKRDVIVTSYFVTYHFATDDDRNIESEKGVSKATWDRIKEEDKVMIQYLYTDPGQSRLADEAHAVEGYVYMGLGIAAALIALFFLRLGSGS